MSWSRTSNSGGATKVFLLSACVCLIARPAPAQDAAARMQGTLAEVVAAYAAKTSGSGIFVCGRDLQSIRDRELSPETPQERVFGGMLEIDVDERRQAVTATFGGVQRRVICRDGLGCTLLFGQSVDELRHQATYMPDPLPADPGATPWPTGDLLPGTRPAGTCDADVLKAAIDAAFVDADPEHPTRTYGVVVVHSGRLVAERYAPGFHRDTPMFGASMTKSIIDALVGIRVGQGKLDPDAPSGFSAWSGDDDPRASITLEQMLRMSSGLSCDESRDLTGSLARMLLAHPDAAAFAGSIKELSYPPGTRWRYCNGTTNIIARVLRDSFHDDEAYLGSPRRALFNRIGMRTAVLEVDPSGTFVGSSFMYASARDWARFGLLYLHDGVWEGERILPVGWVARSLTPSPAAPSGMYGRHWWLNAGSPGNPDDCYDDALPRDLFMAMGMWGQVVAVIPSKDLVVVRLGMSKTRSSWSHRLFLRAVLAAFE